ncbi:glycosyltransferase family 2 protein [Butyrivibrio sp. DSM 10294]|uniref:glycosyltransferase family 2 protein n=1 Tax=Butyrivibrio sp. DSM 10294 TaxID=2972457 RepID=UPI00234FAC7E|nr:glycosyltransferase family 2 protein [Butyrivibrio sp. DSM 10294]MDC7292989.1 glycosyltransferase family 2 protein [Butyrivibrio sp. DSM 10294]
MGDKKEVLFSIIIPVYQAKGTLKRCVLSCLDQKYVEDGEMEIILVDDGSTDGSGELCDELAGEYGLTVVHTGNCGVSHARNIGIERATGRFVVFVDSDDELKDEFLDNCLKYADEGTVLVDETDSYRSTSKISGYGYIENSILNANTHVWGKLFSLEALNSGKVRFPEGLTIGEDLIFLLDFALAQEKKRNIRCISMEHYVYTDNAEGAMNRAFKESYLDQITCWKMAEERILPAAEFISPYTLVTLATCQIMTAMLVVEKLAMAGQGKVDKDIAGLAVTQVKEQITHALKTRGAYAALPAAHKLKVAVFRISPGLYMKLYGRLKGVN